MLRSLDPDRLRLYPQPLADGFRDTAAALNRVARENVIAANGSDDVLTIAVRGFCSAELELACVEPSYSLYPVLAGLQGAKCRKIALNDDFSLPEDLERQAAGANLLLIPSPNAPTGNIFPKARLRKLCSEFRGVVLIDEAYADFADDNCMELAREMPNVIVSRTMSKSYSLAGLRLGYAVACKPLIDGMMKVKDSYNVDLLAQLIGTAALSDQDYLAKTTGMIRKTRERLAGELCGFGFEVMPSQANFLFVSPPDRDGRGYFERLREQGVITRYFPGNATGRFVRISIGTDAEIDRVLELTAGFYI